MLIELRKELSSLDWSRVRVKVGEAEHVISRDEAMGAVAAGVNRLAKGATERLKVKSWSERYYIFDLIHKKGFTPEKAAYCAGKPLKTVYRLYNTAGEHVFGASWVSKKKDRRHEKGMRQSKATWPWLKEFAAWALVGEYTKRGCLDCEEELLSMLNMRLSENYGLPKGRRSVFLYLAG